jgi:hypothetical protein
MNDALLTNIIADITDSINDRTWDLNSTEALKVYKEVTSHCQAWIEALHNVMQDRIDVLTWTPSMTEARPDFKQVDRTTWRDVWNTICALTSKLWKVLRDD